MKQACRQWIGGIVLGVAVACAQPALAASAPPMSAEQLKAVGAIFAAPENAAAGKRWGEQFKQAMQQRLRALAASGEPRKLYVAALLWDAAATQAPADGKPSEQARAWLQAAVDARPRDALVARYELDSCTAAGLRCAPDEALAFLLASEPDNAEVQLRAIADASRRQDQAAQARHWQDAATASRFAPAAGPLGQALLQAYAGLQWPLPDAAFSRVIEQLRAQGMDFEPRALALAGAQPVWVVHALPALQVFAPCRSAQAGTPRWDECVSVAALMAEDRSNLLVPIFGVNTAVALTAGSPDQQAWLQRQRRVQWLQHKGAEVVFNELMTSASYSNLQTMLGEGEIAAIEAALARKGIAALPPADWTPGNGATVEAGGVLGVTLPAE